MPQPMKDLPDWPAETIARFWEKVKVDQSGCWLWQGAVDDKGYGYFGRHGQMFMAHRVSYALTRGSIRGLSIDHRCRVPGCVNPDHLVAMSHRRNSGGRRNSRKRA